MIENGTQYLAAKVFEEESMEHSAMLFRKACFSHALNPEGLVLHSDNGGPISFKINFAISSLYSNKFGDEQ